MSTPMASLEDPLPTRIPEEPQRESYRRFCLLSVEPVLRRLSSELEMKLEISPEEAAFNIWGLWGHDLAGRAKAFQTLMAAGKSEAEASRLSGLVIPDDM